MQKHTSTIIIFLLLVIIGLLLYNTFRNRIPESAVNTTQTTIRKQSTKPTNTNSKSIDELTDEAVVVPFVKENGKLPEYYIKKGEARQRGWIPSEGNLCEVLPGRAIGGDIFTNRERQLPVKKGRIWYEADLDYNCEHRNSDRLLFSNDGLVFVTHDHYKTFEQK